VGVVRGPEAGAVKGAGAGRGARQQSHGLEEEEDALIVEAQLQARTALAACERAENEVAELKLTVDTLERERDFYFHKLREIELLVQACPTAVQPCPTADACPAADGCLQKVLEILYAKDEAEVT
jgi:RP/EB family microtubule-associated protein